MSHSTVRVAVEFLKQKLYIRTKIFFLHHNFESDHVQEEAMVDIYFVKGTSQEGLTLSNIFYGHIRPQNKFILNAASISYNAYLMTQYTLLVVDHNSPQEASNQSKSRKSSRTLVIVDASVKCQCGNTQMLAWPCDVGNLSAHCKSSSLIFRLEPSPLKLSGKTGRTREGLYYCYNM